jgi:hypothetical protein
VQKKSSGLNLRDAAVASSSIWNYSIFFVYKIKNENGNVVQWLLRRFSFFFLFIQQQPSTDNGMRWTLREYPIWRVSYVQHSAKKEDQSDRLSL